MSDAVNIRTKKSGASEACALHTRRSYGTSRLLNTCREEKTTVLQILSFEAQRCLWSDAIVMSDSRVPFRYVLPYPI